MHVVHNKGVENEPSPSYKTCGTTSKWQAAWKERFRKRYMGTDEIPVNVGTRGMQSRHRYLETLIVCDKQFLEYHKNTDYETYVLTIMNMVSLFLIAINLSFIKGIEIQLKLSVHNV